MLDAVDGLEAAARSSALRAAARPSGRCPGPGSGARRTPRVELPAARVQLVDVRLPGRDRVGARRGGRRGRPPPRAARRRARRTPASPGPRSGYAAIVQLTVRSFCARSWRVIASTGRALPTRSWSRSASSSGSGSPAIMISAPPSSASARATQPRRRLGQSASSAACSINGAPDVVVDVADVDVAGAGGVPGAGERAGERGVLDERGHEDRLAGLDVGADADDQVGVAVDAIHAGRQ